MVLMADEFQLQQQYEIQHPNPKAKCGKLTVTSGQDNCSLEHSQLLGGRDTRLSGLLSCPYCMQPGPPARETEGGERRIPLFSFSFSLEVGGGVGEMVVVVVGVVK